ncbi:hypothetical protein BDK51DRAFT_14012, partial [Blyttiomyces helicus]
PTVSFKLQHGKTAHDISLPLSTCVADLKAHVEVKTGVHANMQKLLYKGVLRDEQTLAEANVKDGVKVMLMASKVEDVLKLASAAATSKAAPASTAAKVERTRWCDQTEHKKILSKGKPDDAEPGVKNKKVPIPPRGVYGLLNSRGGKTRLTFKLEIDQLWIGTNERTQKVMIPSIKAVTSEPIVGMEEYHIVALQLGPTEKSNYFLYFVPAQY